MDQNSAEHLYYQARIFAEGIGVPIDHQKVGDLMRQAAESGSADAMFYMAKMHDAGIAAPPDLKLGRSWLIKAAEANHSGAMQLLGSRMLEESALTGQGSAKAITWLECSAALGNPEAMWSLCAHYYDFDTAKTTQWCKQAADANYRPALTLYGRMLLGQVKTSANKNVDAASRYLRKAARQYDEIAACLLMKHGSKILNLGQGVLTPNAMQRVSNEDRAGLVAAFAAGAWGTIPLQLWDENDRAVTEGGTIIGYYPSDGSTVVTITKNTRETSYLVALAGDSKGGNTFRDWRIAHILG